MIEIPSRFAGLRPVGPIPSTEPDSSLGRIDWPGASGLAEDVRRFGLWMRTEAKRRIGYLYPEVTITATMAENRPDILPLVGQSQTVIAWIWARTVKSPNRRIRKTMFLSFRPSCFPRKLGKRSTSIR